MAMFLFEHHGMLYTNPDAYILSQQVVNWGDKLKVYPIYRKGTAALSGCQEIQVMFYHEGSSGTVDDSYWVTCGEIKDWYRSFFTSFNDNLDTERKVTEFDLYKVVHFKFSNDHPQYFYTKEDLCWYLTNIYLLHQPFVNDEYPSDIE